MRGYSFNPKNEEKCVRAYGKEVHVSPKFSGEICRELKGKKLRDARVFLEDIINMIKPVPIRRFKKGVAHRKGLIKAYAGRYPVKAAKEIMKVLNSAESNAEYKGLNTERLHIRHISVNRGRIIRGFRSRAFGKVTPHNTLTSNIQLIFEEK
jgi:large subunit ribosomal protein L22|tara:strand:- start:739 stop:1194 length:456 start_codon:yes stop_codon:yes gene_type:complete